MEWLEYRDVYLIFPIYIYIHDNEHLICPPTDTRNLFSLPFDIDWSITLLLLLLDIDLYI